MGIQRGRTTDQVGAKIAWIESKFRETKQWIENTGQGIQEESLFMPKLRKSISSTTILVFLSCLIKLVWVVQQL